ncbi:hypothetical protein L3i23_02370 [Herbiconiux sp. L3-i23]|nr:hypothetical protein L3i23_02370 [Herbiconiux sp. L3-i23]
MTDRWLVPLLIPVVLGGAVVGYFAAPLPSGTWLVVLLGYLIGVVPVYLACYGAWKQQRKRV